jgi:hypothetical protein
MRNEHGDSQAVEPVRLRHSKIEGSHQAQVSRSKEDCKKKEASVQEKSKVRNDIP